MNYSNSDVAGLIDQLSRLDTVLDSVSENNDEDAEDVNSCQYSENLQHRAAVLLSAAQRSQKRIDPKIRAAQEKLPIFQRKTELLEVCITICTASITRARFAVYNRSYPLLCEFTSI